MRSSRRFPDTPPTKGWIAGAAGAGGAGIAAGLIGDGLSGGLGGNLLDERDHRLTAQATHQASSAATRAPRRPEPAALEIMSLIYE